MSKNPESESEKSGRVNWDKVRQCIAALVVLAFVSLVLIIAVVSMAPPNAKGGALDNSCMNNMKSLALDLRIYASTNNGRFPYATNWCDALNSFESFPKAFQCPPLQGNLPSYAFNASLSGLNETNINPATVLLFESDKGWNAAGGLEQMTNRHERLIVCLADGSVRRLPKSDLKSLRWEP